MSIISPQFCPLCGTRLETIRFDGRERAYCAPCDRPIFHIPSPSAGVAVVRDEQILLIERKGSYAGKWAIPGGVIEWEERPERAAVRELAEETGLSVDPGDIELLSASRNESRDGRISSIKLNYATEFLETDGELRTGPDVADARFWRMDELDTDAIALRPGARSRIIEAFEHAS